MENCKIVSREIIPWKIYQDVKYGYEISYPNNFFVSDNRTSFTSPENVLRLTAPYVDLWDGTRYAPLWGGKYYDNFMEMLVENVKDNENLEEWIAEKFKLDDFQEVKISPEDLRDENGWCVTSQCVDTIQKIIIGKDIEGIYVHGWVQPYEWNKRYVKYGEKVIVIQNSVFSESENTSTFNQMLSSFRFIEG